MYEPAYRDNYKRMMIKVAKKDRLMLERIKAKIKEIVKNPNLYKPLSNDMKKLRRVHFDPYVLIFSIDEENKIIWFEDFEHHDEVYKSRK